MLAERRRKTFYSNPRGTIWANDKEKFGQKLLSKMGWQEGQGLGKNSNGMTESLKASFKFDSNGLGFQRNNNVWIENNYAYEQILADLAQHHQQPAATITNDDETFDGNTNVTGRAQKRTLDSSDSNTIDLVQKSKVNGRLHYRHKFIKAKNLSMKSQSDLDCIFGKTSSNPSSNDPWTNTFSVQNKKSNEMKDEIKGEIDEETIAKIDNQNCDDEKLRRKFEKKERKRRRRMERENAEMLDGNKDVKVEIKEEEEEKEKNKKDDPFFRTIESKLSVQDYFKIKMEQLKKKNKQKMITQNDKNNQETS